MHIRRIDPLLQLYSHYIKTLRNKDYVLGDYYTECGTGNGYMDDLQYTIGAIKYEESIEKCTTMDQLIQYEEELRKLTRFDQKQHIC